MGEGEREKERSFAELLRHLMKTGANGRLPRPCTDAQLAEKLPSGHETTGSEALTPETVGHWRRGTHLPSKRQYQELERFLFGPGEPKELAMREQRNEFYSTYERCTDAQTRSADTSSASAKSIAISIANSDVRSFSCDALILKYPQALLGAERAVFHELSRDRDGVVLISKRDLPKPGGYELTKTENLILADCVLFLGTVRLRIFGLKEIKEFARSSLSILADMLPAARHVAATVHGVKIGLNEVEALTSEVAGFAEAISAGTFPREMNRLTIVLRDQERAIRLRKVLNSLYPDGVIPRPN